MTPSKDYGPVLGRTDVQGSGIVRKAILTCSGCRRKKTRCDRTLPCCLLCSKLQQECIYPTRRLKPGPRGRSSLQQRNNACLVGLEEEQPWQVDAHKLVENDTCATALDGNDQNSVSFDTDDNSNFPTSPEAEINFVKAISLSALIHPTHEPCPHPTLLHKDQISSGSLLNLIGVQSLLVEACHRFYMSIQVFQRLTDSYFDNMTTFSLFHRPSFGQKIQDIKNPLHLQALFAAMFSYSAKFEPTDSAEYESALTFHQLALELIDSSLKELSDCPPPLYLLQSMIIITFCELTKGVRARAWRLLGSCVRLGYELHLHLIDYEARDEEVKIGPDLARWTIDEERRRCWWAIWEMDTFASTIRRCPTAIDWNMIDTYLPVQDSFWFNNEYHSSCFLELESTDQGKSLAKHGNENPNAWLIVVNAIMRTAQVLLRGNLHGVLLNVNPHNNSDQLLHYFRNSFRKKKTQDDSMRLKTLIHALENVSTNLPAALVYRGEYLDFGSDEPSADRNPDIARLHSAKYNIYLTIQLARFMIYHHFAFGEIVSGIIFSEKHNVGEQNQPKPSQGPSQNAQGLQNCLQVADNICALTESCAKEHVKHVSPFHASTVWLAASLQVLREIFGTSEDVSKTSTKCETLRSACGRFTDFWQTPLALLENLNSLASRLSSYRDFSLAAATTKHGLTPAGGKPNHDVSPSAGSRQSQNGLNNGPLGFRVEDWNPREGTHEPPQESTSGSHGTVVSGNQFPTIHTLYQSNAQWVDDSMLHGTSSTNVDSQYALNLLNSVDRLPCPGYNIHQDYYGDHAVGSNNEIGVDSAISQYLLNMFSEEL